MCAGAAVATAATGAAAVQRVTITPEASKTGEAVKGPKRRGRPPKHGPLGVVVAEESYRATKQKAVDTAAVMTVEKRNTRSSDQTFPATVVADENGDVDMECMDFVVAANSLVEDITNDRIMRHLSRQHYDDDEPACGALSDSASDFEDEM